MLSYDKLFEIMKRRNIKKTDLLKVISRGSLAKLNKGENLQTEVIEKICNFLSVQPGDIMTYSRIHTLKEIDPNGNMQIYYEAGYREELSIEYPCEENEFCDNTEIFETYFSKQIHNDKDAIKREKKPIPDDFIKESIVHNKDTNFKRLLNETINKNNNIPN